MKKVMLQLEETNGVYEIYNLLNENNEEIGKVTYRYNKEDKVIYIKSLYIILAYRKQGYGTLCVNMIREKFKGCWMVGDILYPRAVDFWIKFDKHLKNCDRYSPDLWFEFNC